MRPMKQSTQIMWLLIAFLLFLLADIESKAQDWGAFAHVAPETIYDRNIAISAGASYKELRLGLYYQSAGSPDGRWVRKGIIFEGGIAKVDNVFFLSGGVRVLTTNKDFVSVTPHLTGAFRFWGHYEIPITVSLFEAYPVASIGVRVLFKKD